MESTSPRIRELIIIFRVNQIRSLMSHGSQPHVAVRDGKSRDQPFTHNCMSQHAKLPKVHRTVCQYWDSLESSKSSKARWRGDDLEAFRIESIRNRAMILWRRNLGLGWPASFLVDVLSSL